MQKVKKPTAKKVKKSRVRVLNQDGDYMSLKRYLTTLSEKQEQELYHAMVRQVRDYKESQKKLDFVGLKWLAPTTVHDTLALIADLSLIIDMYLNRTGGYNLYMLLAKAPQEYWETIAKHVGYPVEGDYLPLANMDAKRITDPALVVEALGVFAEGLGDIDIPDMYLHYCTGVSPQAVQMMVLDMHKLGAELAKMESVDIGAVFGRALATEASVLDHVRQQRGMK